jgi:hypothetical protein
VKDAAASSEQEQGASAHSTRNLLPGLPLVDSPLFPTLRSKGAFGQYLAAAESLHNKGYAIVDLDEATIATFAEPICSSLKPCFDLAAWRHSTDHHSLRIQDAWKNEASVRHLALLPEILDLLETVYGRKPFAFQTLNFPVGTQQHFHSDAVHFHSEPAGFMCGVWIALEDIHSDSGPLEYFPCSHRLPYLQLRDIGKQVSDDLPATQEIFHAVWQAMVRSEGLQKLTFTPRRGQALIWAANLLHGGAAVRDRGLTRWSQVTHYFFENCLHYTPLHSDWPWGSIAWRRPLDAATGAIRPVTIPDWKDDALIARLADFTPENYLTVNPDVKAAGVNPWVHLLRHGLRERRSW